MDLLEELLAQEHRVWAALQHGDAAADLALLAPGFLGLYPSGYADRSDHAAQLAAGPSVAQYSVEDARVLPLRDGLAMLTYLVTYARPGPERRERMWVSSLWERQAGSWVNLFSQDTPCEKPFIPV